MLCWRGLWAHHVPCENCHRLASENGERSLRLTGSAARLSEVLPRAAGEHRDEPAFPQMSLMQIEFLDGRNACGSGPRSAPVETTQV